MKKLFDETYSENRTIWYQCDALDRIFGEADDYGMRELYPERFADLIDVLDGQMAADIREQAAEVTQTNWIFYSGLTAKDALGDTVRFTVFIRLQDGLYRAHVNLSDYQFATMFDELDFLAESLEEVLNKKEF